MNIMYMKVATLNQNVKEVSIHLLHDQIISISFCLKWCFKLSLHELFQHPCVGQLVDMINMSRERINIMQSFTISCWAQFSYKTFQLPSSMLVTTVGSVHRYPTRLRGKGRADICAGDDLCQHSRQSPGVPAPGQLASQQLDLFRTSQDKVSLERNGCCLNV